MDVRGSAHGAQSHDQGHGVEIKTMISSLDFVCTDARGGPGLKLRQLLRLARQGGRPEEAGLLHTANTMQCRQQQTHRSKTANTQSQQQQTQHKPNKKFMGFNQCFVRLHAAWLSQPGARWWSSEAWVSQQRVLQFLMRASLM